MLDTVYILSAGRSGSTLLNRILGNNNPAAEAVGELTHLPKNLALNSICSCGTPVKRCPMWSQVLPRMSDVSEDKLSADPYALDLGYIGASKVVDHRVLTKRYRTIWKIRHGLVYLSWLSGLPGLDVLPGRFNRSIGMTRKLYRVIRSFTGKQLIVDSSKNYLKGIGMYRSAPESTRLLLLVRDGRASFNSRLRNGFSWKQSLEAWKDYYEHALPLVNRQVDESHILHLKYEDLVSNPTLQIERICAFLGLEFSQSMLNIGGTTQHILNGNRMRLQSESKIVFDNAWRAELGPEAMSYFERRAGLLNRRLGYI